MKFCVYHYEQHMGCNMVVIKQEFNKNLSKCLYTPATIKMNFAKERNLDVYHFEWHM